MTEPRRHHLVELIVLAAAGVGKVDYHGPRGVSLVSQDEIEAMAVLLACLGLRPVHPNATRDEAEALGQALSDFFNTHFNGGSDGI